MTKSNASRARNVLSVVVGVFASMILIMVVQTIGHTVYPVPGQMDPNDQEAMRRLLAELPPGALLFVIASYAAGSFGGGFVAALIGRGRRIRLALIVGFVLLLAGIANLVAIPHPLWVSVLTVLVFLPFAWLGGLAAAGGEAPPAPPQSSA